MKAIYSFVIDGDKKFDSQSRVLVTTLMNVGVPSSQIIAHVTPTASRNSIDFLSANGIRRVPLSPFLDGKYCNKLVQLDTLLSEDAEFYVLCDTDLAFLDTIEPLFDARHIRAKPVDLPNPPLEQLETLKLMVGACGTPRLVKTSCEDVDTWSVNCNGGLYIIPKQLAANLSERWKYFATELRNFPTTFGKWYINVDQVSFAMAMLSCGYDTEEIPIEFNFPMHLGMHFGRLAFDAPRVLHYHWLHDDSGQLTKTGHSVVDRAVEYVNALLLNVRRAEPLVAEKEKQSVFAYWDGSDRSSIREFVDVWTSCFPAFRVYGNDDVTRLINKYVPNYSGVFEAIRIPAAKADIARLMLLYEHGGLYVDCHCGIRDEEAISRLLASLGDYEGIFVDRQLAQEPRPPEEHFLINAIMLSRPKSKLIVMLAQQALANLLCHREFERLSGHVPYHIGSLTGPGLITSMVLEPCTKNREIRSDYRDRILIVREESAPIERNRHRTYGGHGQHWSERQRSELLFE
jgi:hypothetical protein